MCHNNTILFGAKLKRVKHVHIPVYFCQNQSDTNEGLQH